MILFLGYFGCAPAPACIYVLSTELHRAIDLRTMIKVVGQRCMHLGRGQVELIRDLGATLPLMFVPDHDVLYRDPMSRDTWLPDSGSGRGLNTWIHTCLNQIGATGARLRQGCRPPSLPILPGPPGPPGGD